MRIFQPFLIVVATVFMVILTGCGQRKGAANSAEPDAGMVEETLATNSTADTEEQMRQLSLEGDIEKVTALLDAGTDVNAMDMDGRSALMFAAFNGHSEVVLKLLEKGAVLDRRDLMGRTALLYAATGPFPETVRILLDKGAEPNVVDSGEHFSPLMHAAAEGNLDVVKILLEAGADLTLKDVDGDDASFFAAQAGHMEVVKTLETARPAKK